MTIIRQYKTALVGPNIDSLPRYFPPLGGVNPSDRWLASTLANGVVGNWPASIGSVPLDSNGTNPSANSGSVTLDGVDDMLRATITLPKTFYLVAKTDGTFAEAFLSYGSYGVRQIDAAGQFAFNQPGGAASYKTFSVDNAKHSVVMVATDGVAPPRLYVNGVELVGTNAGPFSGQVQIGKYGASAFGGLNILEAGAFTEALTAAQALAVYKDLKIRYTAIQ